MSADLTCPLCGGRLPDEGECTHPLPWFSAPEHEATVSADLDQLLRDPQEWEAAAQILSVLVGMPKEKRMDALALACNAACASSVLRKQP